MVIEFSVQYSPNIAATDFVARSDSPTERLNSIMDSTASAKRKDFTASTFRPPVEDVVPHGIAHAFGQGKTSDFNGKPLVVVAQDDLWLRRLRPKRFASLVNGKHPLNRLDPYGVPRMGHLSPVPAFAPFARVPVDDLAK